MSKQSKQLSVFFTFLMSLMLIASCANQQSEPTLAPQQEKAPEVAPAPQMKVLKVGSVMPLTGEGAVYGLPVQKVIQKAAEDLNKKWESKSQKLEVFFEDGKCNPKDGLTATRQVVQLKGVKAIIGNGCSGETLGAAPFANENKVVMLSPLSSSPEVSKAGDYIFRNYPSDTAQVAVMTDYIAKQKHKKVALLSENTDYAQALRKGYLETLPIEGMQIVADEIVQPNAKDVRTEVLKVKGAKPDAVILLPQTIPMGITMVKQLIESNVDLKLYSNEVAILKDAVKNYPDEADGLTGPQLKFEENAAFKALRDATGCDLGAYCVTGYDSVFLMAELLEKCGDQDSDCIKKGLYETKAWKGPLGGPYTFDPNGDVGGNFEVLQLKKGDLKTVNG